MLKKFREPVNGLTHLAAAGAAAVGAVVLVLPGPGSLVRTGALLLYGIALVLMFAASAAYHLVRLGPKGTLLLRKLDHSAIYLLIAGTYTPICLHFFSGFWREPLLAVIWVLAAAGIILKLFVINAPRWVTAGIYLVMGWISVLALGEILQAMPTGALIWLVLGGLFFTVGAVVYIFKWPDLYPRVFGFHEIWHVFVILGAFSHFILILLYVSPYKNML